MNRRMFAVWSVGVSAAIAFALSACGGGSGSQTMPGDGEATFLPVPMVPGNHGIMSGAAFMVLAGASEEHGNVVVSCPSGGEACEVSVATDGTLSYRGGEPSVTYVLEPGGLVAGSVPEVFANSGDDTLKRLLPTGASVLPPVTGAVKRNYVEPDRGIERPDEKAAYLNSIASDGAGGFRVTYVIDGVETPVHFAADDYSRGNFAKELDGSTYYLWPVFGSFTLDPDDPSKRRDDGNPFFDYADNVGWSVVSLDGVNNDYRGYASFGMRTNDLPSGRATYGARMLAELWDGNDPDFGSGRSLVRGNMRLEADFKNSEISGRVHAFQVRAPGASQWDLMADGNSIDISNGRIAEGRFAARWIGRDTDVNSAAEDSVRGFEGTILGEFYGPTAEEVGGVLNGSRAATDTTSDQQLTGSFLGRKQRLTVPEGDLSLMSVAAYRDHPASTSQHTDAAEVTAIESDDAGGYRVTYVVDDSEHSIHLTANDYGSFPACWACYHQRVGNRSYFLWSFSRSLSRMPEFDHFNVGAWSVGDWMDAGYTISDSVEHRGVVVYGAPTATLPAGTASYEGRVFAEGYQRDDPNSRTRRRARGRLDLTADFDASTVGGMIDEIEVTPSGKSFFIPTSGNWMIENGAIAGSQFTAELTGTQSHAGLAGDMTGQFFGPSAAEVGGVLKATSARNRVVYGYFGGTKQ